MHKKQVTLKNALRAVFASLALLTACPVLAATDGIMVKDAWVRAAPPSATVQAGFFTLINHNNETIVLTAVAAEGFGHSELHLSSKRDGVMVMEQQQQITVPADSALQFKPGSYHIMLMQPAQIAAPGELVKVSFTLANGETFSTEMTVKRDNNKAMMDHSKMKHGAMQHHKMATEQTTAH